MVSKQFFAVIDYIVTVSVKGEPRIIRVDCSPRYLLFSANSDFGKLYWLISAA